MNARQIVTWAALLIGLAGLILQIALTVPARLMSGDTIFGAVIFYFSFFTILTNLMLVLIYLSELRPGTRLSWFRAPETRGMMAALITLVMVFYHFVLGPTWHPEGLWLVADMILHYLTPILYLVWWVLFAWHGRLNFSNIPAMLVPPLIYLVYAMGRGAITGEYPYPVIEANVIGYGQVAINVALLLVGVALLCAIVVVIDRLLGKTRLVS